jgi:hypothetical protein
MTTLVRSSLPLPKAVRPSAHPLAGKRRHRRALADAVQVCRRHGQCERHQITHVIATTSRSRAPRSLLLRRWTDSLPTCALRQLIGRAAGLRFIGLWLFGFLVALHLTLRHCRLPCWLLALNHRAVSESNRGHRVSPSFNRVNKETDSQLGVTGSNAIASARLS